MSLAAVDLDLVEAIERASVWGWPPSSVEERDDGWILRATPGLDRGRSCHALTPRLRALLPGELPLALKSIRVWSRQHGIRGGIQISPLEVHGDLPAQLVAAGWEPAWKVWVMAVDRAEALALSNPSARSGDCPAACDERFLWRCDRGATESWLSVWTACQPSSYRTIIEIHARTVFQTLAGRGIFGRLGNAATGIAVEDGVGDWAGLFSLVVRPDRRGHGLGRRLVRCLLEAARSERVYLQVNMDNPVALSLYRSFGFEPVHSYQHLLAPLGWAA